MTGSYPQDYLARNILMGKHREFPWLDAAKVSLCFGEDVSVLPVSYTRPEDRDLARALLKLLGVEWSKKQMPDLLPVRGLEDFQPPQDAPTDENGLTLLATFQDACPVVPVYEGAGGKVTFLTDGPFSPVIIVDSAHLAKRREELGRVQGRS